jgi:CHASE2 domain-containing sensor protein
MRTRDDLLEVAGFVGRGLLLLLAFMSAHFLLTESPLGLHVKHFEYALLQESLIGDYWSRHPANSSELPLVLDVSESHSAGIDTATDRKALDELLQEVCQYSPAAIGVDIDFSPASEMGDPLDWMYFNRWKSLQTPEGKPVPVRLGVYRRANDAPRTWLGRLEFAELAAGVAKPIDRQFNYFEIWSRGNSAPLLQLAASLDAATRPKGDTEAVAHLRSKLEINTTPLMSQYGTYVIDFSSLDEIQNHRTFMVPAKVPLPGSLRSLQEKIRGSVVLIGDVEHGDDKFLLPHRDKTVAGVLIHACSLVTLREGALKYIGGNWGRFAGFLLCGLALGVVAMLRTLSVFQPTGRKLDFDRIEFLLTGLMAVAVYLQCTWLIGRTRVFWPDFLWVALSLLAYPFLSKPLWNLCVLSYKTIQSSVMAFVTQKGHTHDQS